MHILKRLKLNYRWPPGWLYISIPQLPPSLPGFRVPLLSIGKGRKISRSLKLYWPKDQTEIISILSKNSLSKSISVKAIILNGSEADLGNI